MDNQPFAPPASNDLPIKSEADNDLNPEDFKFKGFWIRAIAFIIDLIILGAVQAFIAGIFFSGLLFEVDDVMIIISSIFDNVLSAAYFIAMHAIWSATIGKMIFKAQVVVAATGEPMGIGRTIGRYFATFLSSIPLGLGYFWAGWDKEKRTFHDMICGTRVVAK